MLSCRFSAVPFLGSEGYWAFSCSFDTVLHDFHIYTLWEILSGLSFITAYDIFIQKVPSPIVKSTRCLQSLGSFWVCHTRSIENTSFQLKFYLPGLNPLVKLLDILKSIANAFWILRYFLPQRLIDTTFKRKSQQVKVWSSNHWIKEKDFQQKQCILPEIH